MLKRSALVAALALSAALPSRALVAGDLMFTSLNADNDSWSLAVLADLAPNTQVYFSDNAWDDKTQAFVGGESHHLWNTGPRLITAGTVVGFSKTDHAAYLAATVGTLSRAYVPGNTNYGLSQTGETLYAYQGGTASAPRVFISAVSTDGFSSAVGSLAGTGLVEGLTASALANSTDYAEYTGPRSGLAADQFRTRLASAANWAELGDGSFAARAPDIGSLAVVAIPEPAGIWLGLAGITVLALRRRRLHTPGSPACGKT